MARRKTPKDASLAEAEAEDVVRVRSLDALIAQLESDAKAPVTDNGVTVRHGDAGENPDEYVAHRDALAEAYGIVGPIETMLLDRVAGISWRLQRLQRVERGAIGVRAHNSRLQLHRNAEHRVAEERDALVGTGRSIVHTDNPEVLRAGAGQLREIIEELDEGITPDFKAAALVLGDVFGFDEDGRPKGRGDTLAVFLHKLESALDNPEDPDHHTVKRAQKTMRSYIAGQLREVERLLVAYEGPVRRHAKEFADAMVDLRSWMKQDDVKSMVLYERHLEKALREATRELERAVARRRLAGMASMPGLR